MPPPLGVFEVQLVVTGLAAMEAFYADLLGLAASLHDAERGRTHFRLARGQLILARAEGERATSPDWPGLPPPLLEGGDRRGPGPLPHGPVHFAIEVQPGELVSTGERLRAQGLDVRGPFRWPGGHFSVYVRDPEGNVAELIAAPL
jgi:catechol 2,3-dioxygenase-like lactoylglutathione lyase family enzyme